MKVVILAGGLGSRISEADENNPKPLLEIGGMPILWHIMKGLSVYGINEFIICAGYKQHVIKEYFADYFLHTSDVTYDFTNGKNEMTIHQNSAEPWKVTVVDTGIHTMTGGRIKKIKPYIGEESFLITYGDGVTDINISKLITFHKNHGKMATVSAYNAGQRFGVLDIDSTDAILDFREKTYGDGSFINIGYMVCQPQIIDYIDSDEDELEKNLLVKMAKTGELMAYRHYGFWKCMDTLREKEVLEKMWANDTAPWKVWK